MPNTREFHHGCHPVHNFRTIKFSLQFIEFELMLPRKKEFEKYINSRNERKKTE